MGTKLLQGVNDCNEVVFKMLKEKFILLKYIPNYPSKVTLQIQNVELTLRTKTKNKNAKVNKSPKYNLK